MTLIVSNFKVSNNLSNSIAILLFMQKAGVKLGVVLT